MRKLEPKRKPSFHVPFEEFPVSELADLLRRLEEAKPADWIVEVSNTEDAQHMACMKSLVHVLVHRSDEDPTPGSMGVIYQYCPNCKTAVRVL